MKVTDITETAGAAWVSPAYSRAGDMTTVPQPASLTTSYGATYDAWNRLVKLINTGNSQTVSEYQYDGVKARTVQKSYSGGTLSETRHFYYTAEWQVIEERLGTSPDSANPNRQFIWGLRYVDDCILRDRDTDGNGSLDERLYATQDANWNVTGTLNTSGTIQERLSYTAYGVPTFMSSAFVPQADTLAWETLYAGYRYEANTRLFHVRNRVLHPYLATWTSRDPDKSEYVVHLYVYAIDNPLTFVDPDGAQIKGPGGIERPDLPADPRPKPPPRPPYEIPPIPIPPKTDRDKLRQMIENAGCSSTCKKDLEKIFAEADHIEATEPYDAGLGPCGTFGSAFWQATKDKKGLLSGLTCATIEQKYYHIIPPIRPWFGSGSDYHHVIKITMNCKNCPVTFYLDAGTTWGGGSTGNVGGDDNVFFDLPKTLYPTLGTGENMPTDAEFEKLCKEHNKGWGW
jgi:RHS repeat-associated protein